jgi:hypothetical protein
MAISVALPLPALRVSGYFSSSMPLIILFSDFMPAPGASARNLVLNIITNVKQLQVI